MTNINKPKSCQDIKNVSIHISSLDGVRGVAVLLVLASHFSANGWPPIPFLDLSGIGKSGVYLFFILSSFLLSLQFLNFDHKKIASKDFWLRYCERRILRIWPLYIFVLLISCVSLFLLKATIGLDKGWPYTINAHDLWMHITLREGFSVLWSIPVEFKYYLILPFVAILNSLLLKNNILFTGITTLIFIIAISVVWPSQHSETNTIELKYYLSIFIIGQYAAVLHHNLNNHLNGANKFQWLFEIAGFMCIVIIIMSVPSIYNFVFSENIEVSHFHRSFIFYAILWGIFLLCVLHGKGYLAKPFSSSFLKYLGLISFSLYLWHGGIIKIGLFTRIPEGAVSSLFLLSASIIIASISHRQIEKPFMNMKLLYRSNRKS